MKKIGIDARLYSQTGVGTYLKNLLYYLEKNSPSGILFYIYLTEKDFYKVTFRKKNFIKRKADYPWHSFSEQIEFCGLLYRDNLDLMHFTYFSYPVFYWRKFIATVHDITPILYKTGKASTKNQFIYQIKHLLFKFVLACQINRAVKIITPTKTVREQLIKIYGSKISNKTQSIYEGINFQLINLKQSSNETMKFNNFFIYVGNFYPHKNVEILIEAFKNIDKKYRLILLGPDDFFSKKLTLSKNIVLFKNPKLSDLIYFYKNTQALIHPSLSEGFGLPLIEAAYFNCPVIVSDIPVFKELLGKNYLSFNPKDVNDITLKIESFIDKKPKFDYSQIVKKYSFKKMTAETVRIYSDVLGK